MKRTIVFFFMMIGAVLASAVPGAATQQFTQNEFMTAESLDPGMTQTGIFFTLADHSKTYYASVRYGMGAMMEFGARFGATSVTVPGSDEKLGGLVGLDLKYQLVKEAEGIPLDLSVDLGYDTTIINSKNASEVTFATIVSKSFALTDRGYKFTPYGGLSMSALYGSLPESNKTFVNGFAGLEWKLSQKFMVLLELKAGGKTIGGAGIRFEY
jgi:hypothetical protein